MITWRTVYKMAHANFCDAPLAQARFKPELSLCYDISPYMHASRHVHVATYMYMYIVLNYIYRVHVYYRA